MSEPRALVIANNDLVYLWWTFPSKIDGCLGFSIRRLQEGRRTVALPAFAHFGEKGMIAESDSARGTTDWFPIQSFQCKDLTVPEEAEVRYRIVPMTGIPGERLKALDELAVDTKPVRASQRAGGHTVVFNRGIISTQALGRLLETREGRRPDEEEPPSRSCGRT